jgi:N-acetylglucosamine-6-phosphate deacetylase
MTENLIIKNTALYYDIKDTTKYDILVSKGKINQILPAGEIPLTENTIEAGNLVAIPGLIDIHIHGAGGSDSLDGTKEALTNISLTLAKLGTTSFLSTMIMKPGEKNIHLQTARDLTGKDLGGAGLLGIYIEGPFINNIKRGGILPDSITGSSVEVLDKILDQTGNALKMMCVAPEITGIAKIIEKLRSSGVKVAFGHSDADYDQTRQGFEMGINHVTHLFNAMRSLHHRDPGPLAAIFEKPEISVEFIGDSHHIHPGLFKMVWYLKGPQNIACVTDGISGTGLPEGTYTYNNKSYTSKNGLARYLDGTFIGSTMGLIKIVSNFKTFTNCTFKEAIDTVTLNPARILGADRDKGSIEEGKDADIVLIDRDFNVKCTIIAGKIVYQNQ